VQILAAFAIGKIGPDGAPAIPALQRLITNSLSANPSRKFSTDERSVPAYALGAMGPAARRALPQLELLRKDSVLFVRATAEAAFIKISGHGLDAIFEPLKHPPPTNWAFATSAIQFLGTNGAPAIPFLIPALQNPNATVRTMALLALRAIHVSPETTIPAILPFVAATNTDYQTRTTALTILRNFGPTARGLVPITTLLQALQDPDEDIRRRATNALRQIDPEAARNAGIDSDDSN
jgi:HEAT repeat protein